MNTDVNTALINLAAAIIVLVAAVSPFLIQYLRKQESKEQKNELRWSFIQGGKLGLFLLAVLFSMFDVYILALVFLFISTGLGVYIYFNSSDPPGRFEVFQLVQDSVTLVLFTILWTALFSFTWV